MKFSNLNLRLKILIPTSILFILALGICIAAMTNVARNIIIDQAIETAKSEASAYAQELKARIDAGMAASRTMAVAIESAMETIPLPNRQMLSDLTYKVAQEHPEFGGAWIVLPPNTYGDSEAEHESKWHGHLRCSTYQDGKGGLSRTFAPADTPLKGEWWDYPKSTDNEIITKPYTWNLTGSGEVLLSSISVPINKGGSFVGTCGVDILFDGLIKLVKDFSIFEKGYGVLIANDGTLVAHKDKKAVGKNLSEFIEDEQLSRAMNAVKNGEKLEERHTSPSTNIDSLYIYEPIRFGTYPKAWSFVVSIPMEIVRAKANSIVNTGLTITGVTLIILLIVMYLLVMTISKPILKTCSFANQVADGQLDACLDVFQKDEIGIMADSLRSMVEDLKDRIAHANEQTAIAERKTEEAGVALEEAEAAKKQAEQANTAGRHQAAVRLEGIVEKITSSSSELNTRIEDSADGAELQKQRSTETATAMEEMTATVIEVASSAGHAAESADTARKLAEDGGGIVNEMVLSIERVDNETNLLSDGLNSLGVQAEDIDKVINVINDIADQTNLLALNAAIEAARAGEAGRGFAVVADEVRKLAEKTIEATKEVGEVVGAIQDGAKSNIDRMTNTSKMVQSSTDLADKAGSALQKILETVADTADQVRAIATAAEEQSATTEEINRSTEEVNRIAIETSESMEQSTRVTNELAKQAEELIQLINELKSS
ncbi:methyl-accepting chemotaxis protein [Maridesulfovibrio bastinii]|uniref:methyl-accepting chemotaxis protein n=1 Tax=Maridesulfovibrio bastinii TaxID=47157 RepID=UPI000420E23E|nr:methyl-accepting chemotaxis protein [Maridesulfovibrio bastinii]